MSGKDINKIIVMIRMLMDLNPELNESLMDFYCYLNELKPINEDKSLDEIKSVWKKDRFFSPKLKKSTRNKLLKGWKLAIRKTLA